MPLQRWIAIFEDKPDSAALRAEHSAAHLAFLRSHKGVIRLCGPVRSAADSESGGGLWLFECDSREEVERIIHADPFFTAGVRASWKLLAWGVAPGFEDVVVEPARP